MNDTYRRQSKAKYERVQKTNPAESVKSTKDVVTEISLIPNSSTRPGTVPTDPYKKQFQVNRLQEKNNYYWNQTNGFKFSKKEFPEFKTALDLPVKKHNVLKPMIRSSSEHLDIDYTRKKETLPKREIPRQETYKKKPEIELIQSSNRYHPSSRTSKKVKWEDGYCASPSLEWYPLGTDYQKYYKDYLPSKTKHSHSYGNFLTYKNDEYNKQYKYRDYDYTKYDFLDHQSPATYPTTRKLRPSDYRDSYQFYTYPRSSKYGDPSNWLYLEEDSRHYNPYHYDYDLRDPNKYGSSTQKSYRNSDTQYDLVERGHNKKLQVCHSEASKISSRKIQVESKKVGDEKGAVRLTKSEEILNKLEDASTQITEIKDQGHQTFLVCNSETKTNDFHKLNENVISKFLLELTEKMKTSEHSLSSFKQKCFLMEKGTQYVDSELKKNHHTSKPSTSTKPPRTPDKKPIKAKVSHLRIVQNEFTQYEEIKGSETYTTSTLNTEFEFERQIIKDANRENFCEIESTKRKGHKSGVCEERIYAKRFIKEIHPKNKGDIQAIVNSEASIESRNLDLKRIHHHRSYGNTKQCLPFLIDKRYNRESPCELTPKYEEKEIKSKHHDHKEKKRSTSLELQKEKPKRKHKGKLNKKSRRAKSVCSSKSDLSGPEDRYLEKYVVKLANPNKDIVLYDVKPKLCDYLDNKGVKKKIVQKLKSKVKD